MVVGSDKQSRGREIAKEKYVFSWKTYVADINIIKTIIITEYNLGRLPYDLFKFYWYGQLVVHQP